MPCQGRRILNPVCLPFHHSGLFAALSSGKPLCYRTFTTIQGAAGREPIIKRLKEPRMKHGFNTEKAMHRKSVLNPCSIRG